jgi:hypothetical protein
MSEAIPDGVYDFRLIRKKLLHVGTICRGYVFDYFADYMVDKQVVLWIYNIKNTMSKT